MSWHQAILEKITGLVLPAWEDIPDLGLYMDQVVTYVERIYRPFFGERRIVTSAMINNYVKSGLIHRPERKKYERGHIARLLIVCALKQAVPLENMRKLLAGQEIEALYGEFCAKKSAAEQVVQAQLDSLDPMQCAMMGAIYTLLCDAILCADS